MSRKAAKQAEMTSATPVEAQLASSREATAAAVEARDAAKAAMATEKEELVRRCCVWYKLLALFFLDPNNHVQARSELSTSSVEYPLFVREGGGGRS